MMANFIQINTFNRGICNYLHAEAYGNANQAWDGYLLFDISFVVLIKKY
jgi:hypothetical protein